MSEFTITTNNVPRFTIGAWELSPKERAEFDYIDWNGIDEGDEGTEDAAFVQYKGRLYDLSKFIKCGEHSPFNGWYGYVSDSDSSGTLIRFVFDYQVGERVIMGRYCEA